MKRITDIAKSFVRDEQGLAVTEYGLLLALVAVALVAVVRTFGSNLATWFTSSTTAITTAKP